ncbi:MAG: hypothetical protein WAU07_02175 [Microgenomates group bacterium]
MKFPEKIWLSCLVFFTLLLPIFLSAAPALAADLGAAQIRLNRQQTVENPVPILVTISPASLATEDEIEISVGSAWTISSTPSDFTVSTSNLPSGVTPYPGVATAIGVSGSVISFPTSDANVGTLYGFYITGGISQNPATGSGTGYQWQITTLDNGLAVDSAAPKVPIIESDQIAVTATVPADTNDLEADLSTITPGTLFNQDEEIVYEITYGSDLPYATNLTVQAEWQLGIISGQGSPTVEVVTYVNGSATDGFGNTAPVIDITNRTITWTLTNFPAHTLGQTVQFTLETGGYTGSSEVDFTVASRITAPTSTVDSEITRTYQYDTPESTPGSSDKKSCNELCSSDSECQSGFCRAESGRCRREENPANDKCDGLGIPPTSSPGSAGSDSSESPKIISHQITSITDSAVRIIATTEPETKLVIRYGTQVNQLSSRISSDAASRTHSFSLAELKPNTQYFYQFEILTNQGSLLSSLYSFTTAEVSTPADIDFTSTMFIIQGIPLFSSNLLGLGQIPILVMPRNSSLDAVVSFNNFGAIDTVFLELRSSGLNGNQGTSQNSYRSQLQEHSPGDYSGPLFAPDSAGWYDVYIQVRDEFGNVTETLIGKVHSTGPLQVLDTLSGKPIAGAKVLFKSYNPRIQIYSIIKSGSFLGENPLFTDESGKISIILPLGKYRAQVSANGYRTDNFDFTIGAKDSEVYPTIRLEPTSGIIVSAVRQQFDSAKSYFEKLIEQIALLQKSPQNFAVAVVIFQLMLAMGLLITFCAKSRIPILALPKYFFLLARETFFAKKSTAIVFHGLISDAETGMPLVRATIVAIDKIKNAVLSNSVTNKNGFFHIDFGRNSMMILISAIGYTPVTHMVNQDSVAKQQFFLKKNTTIKISKFVRFNRAIQKAIGYLFEPLLVLAVVSAVFISTQLGLLRVIPFIGYMLWVTALWILYLFEQQLYSTKSTQIPKK